MSTIPPLSAGQGQLEGFEHSGSSREIVRPPLLNGQEWHTALEVAVDYAKRLEENGGPAEEKSKLSMVFVDVDRLKEVNDNFGHEVGDMVIEAVTTTAQELNDQNNITAGRIGGDEFALFAWSRDDNESARLANKLKQELKRFAEDYEEGALIDTGLDLSTGISRYTPGMSASDLLKAADDAMYKEKLSRIEFNKLHLLAARVAKVALIFMGVRQRDLGRLMTSVLGKK